MIVEALIYLKDYSKHLLDTHGKLKCWFGVQGSITMKDFSGDDIRIYFMDSLYFVVSS